VPLGQPQGVTGINDVLEYRDIEVITNGTPRVNQVF